MPTTFDNEVMGWLPENGHNQGQIFGTSDPSNAMAMRANHCSAAAATAAIYEALAHGQGGNPMNIGMDQTNNQMGGAPATHHQHQHQNHHNQHQHQHGPHHDQAGTGGLPSWHQTYTPSELLSAYMQQTSTQFPPHLIKHEMGGGSAAAGGPTAAMVGGQPAEAINPTSAGCGIGGRIPVHCGEEAAAAASTVADSTSVAPDFGHKIPQINI